MQNLSSKKKNIKITIKNRNQYGRVEEHAPNLTEYPHYPIWLLQCFPLGRNTGTWKGKSKHLKGSEPAGANLKASVPVTWDLSLPPLQVVTATEQRGSPTSYMARTAASSLPAPSTSMATGDSTS